MQIRLIIGIDPRFLRYYILLIAGKSHILVLNKLYFFCSSVKVWKLLSKFATDL